MIIIRTIMSGVQASKALLRQEIKAKLMQLGAEDKKRQSDAVYNKLINLPVFKSSSRVSIYLSTDLEIATENIIREIFNANKKCFVPRYNGNVMEMVRLKSMQDWDTLPLTKWNIKQPSLKEEREEALETGGMDLIILPGVGFSKTGSRLGHGKGYYDSYLSKVFKSQDKRPATVGVCFKEQLMEEIPTHDHDVKLDIVLFE